MAAGSLRAGDWQCPNPSCLNHTEFPSMHVFGSKVNCPKCGTGKTAQRPGDWCCPNPNCVNHQNTVYGSKSSCSRCGTAKPVAAPTRSAADVQRQAHGVPSPRPGDWHCLNNACKNHRDNVIFASKTECPLCGLPKPLGQDLPVPPAAPQVGFTPPVGGARPGDWHCPNPGCKNHAENAVYGVRTECPLCGMAKPTQPLAVAPSMQGGPTRGLNGPGAPGKPSVQPGDWHCPNPACKNHTDNVVFASKPSCPLCHAPKPEVPNTVMLEPPSMVSGRATRPGDWHCASPECKNHRDNVVFASKTSCPVCGAPKPTQASQAPLAQQMSNFAPMQNGAALPAPMVHGHPTRQGDWHCANPSCKNHKDNVVYASKTACPICHAPKPVQQQAMSPQLTGMQPGFPMQQPMAGFPAAMAQPMQIFQQFQLQMQAAAAAAAQFHQQQSPFQMQSVQQSAQVANGSSKPNVRPGDWHCSNSACKNHTENIVFGSKMECPICGSPRPALDASGLAPAGGQGMPPQGGAAGLRPGDWLCPNAQCKNHLNGVYRSRSSCGECGAPQPDAQRQRSRSPARHSGLLS